MSAVGLPRSLTSRTRAADKRPVLATSTGYVAFTSLLPFVVLFGFWFFLMRNVRTRMPTQYQPLVDKLEEIRVELERLRKSVGDRDQDRFGFGS